MNSFTHGFLNHLSRIADLIILNILWVVCALPIITIGASTTALYAMLLKFVKNEEDYIIKGFFKEFKDNFKQATCIWILFLIAFFVLGIDLFVARGISTLSIFQIPVCMFLVITFGLVIYTFALLARFKNTSRHIIKNACILFFAKLPYTVILLLLSLGPMYFMFMTVRNLYYGLFFYSMLGVALVAWLHAIVLRRIFDEL